MAETLPNPTININYLKSPSYREISFDGALGAATPRQKIWIAFYNERVSVPVVIQHNLVAGEKPGEFRIDAEDAGTPLEGRPGLIRTMEFGAFMSLDAAKELRDWLALQIKTLEGESQK